VFEPEKILSFLNEKNKIYLATCDLENTNRAASNKSFNLTLILKTTSI